MERTLESKHRKSWHARSADNSWPGGQWNVYGRCKGEDTQIKVLHHLLIIKFSYIPASLVIAFSREIQVYFSFALNLWFEVLTVPVDVSLTHSDWYTEGLWLKVFIPMSSEPWQLVLEVHAWVLLEWVYSWWKTVPRSVALAMRTFHRLSSL